MKSAGVQVRLKLRRQAAALAAAILVMTPLFADCTVGEERPLVARRQFVDAAAFVDHLGVNTHLSWPGTPYSDLPRVVGQLNYLGVRNLRDDVGQYPGGPAAVAAMMRQGFRFDLIAGRDLDQFVGTVRSLRRAHPGILAVEGPNEVDGGGLRGGPERAWWVTAQHYQRRLFERMRADRELADIPIYNVSVASVSAGRILGDLSTHADFANLHLYFGGGQPAYGWSPDDPTFAWSNWVRSARAVAPGRPLVITEIGASATPAWGGGVNEETQARQVLNALMDAAQTPVAATYIYELADSRNRGESDEQSHYGLFRWDGSPRPAATAVRNLLRILEAPSTSAPSAAASSLAYRIEGVPKWGGHLLFRKRGGEMALAVWAEPDIWDERAKRPIPPSPVAIGVDFAKAARLTVYDPMRGSSPIRVIPSGRRLMLDLTDHPLIVVIADDR